MESNGNLHQKRENKNRLAPKIDGEIICFECVVIVLHVSYLIEIFDSAYWLDVVIIVVVVVVDGEGNKNCLQNFMSPKALI